jgi:hypothetical protein
MRKCFHILIDMESSYRYIAECTCGVILLAIRQIDHTVSGKFLTFFSMNAPHIYKHDEDSLLKKLRESTAKSVRDNSGRYFRFPSQRKYILCQYKQETCPVVCVTVLNDVNKEIFA